MAKLQIIDQHARLVTRMLEILDEEGVVRRVKEGWEVVSPWRQDVPGPTSAICAIAFPITTLNWTCLTDAPAGYQKSCRAPATRWSCFSRKDPWNRRVTFIKIPQCRVRRTD